MYAHVSMGMGASPAAFVVASALLFLGSLSPSSAAAAPVDVGVILDRNSLLGKRCRTSITMAAEDFYRAHGNYSTRIALHFRDSEMDVVGAASAALDLVKNIQVKAIIGPQTSTETDFVLDLGSKTHVPVVSFSATSPTLSAARTPYFVRATFSDSSQAGAIAAVVQKYAWREVVLVYEDSEYGAGIVPYLIDALEAVDARVAYRSVIPASATGDHLIDTELYKLMAMQTRVFVVHMLPTMGSRFFLRAKKLGLMNQGFAWIAAGGLTDVLDILGQAVIHAMEGVIGVRPYVQRTPEIVNFSARFRARFAQDNPRDQVDEPTVFQWRAYDTIWALAMAVEAVQSIDSGFAAPPSVTNNSTDLGRVGVSRTGPALLDAISKTHFTGLAGEFRLVDGQLKSSVYEILNIIGQSWRGIGFWSPENGLTKELKPSGDGAATGLKVALWPGDSSEVPRGWEPLVDGKKLRIGVPVKKGFKQFVEVDHADETGKTNPAGYCIDVFQAVVDQLPFPLVFDYFAFGDSSSSYDNLVYQVYLKNYDAVVGDTTIISNRTQFVDFTLPYTESGVSMVVPVKPNKNKTAWIFLDPLTTDLWLGTFAFFVFTAFVVWVIEHPDNEEFGGTASEQLGTIFYFAFSILVFAHKEKLKNNLSRLVVIIWVFVVLILTSSYTASLTSMLTVQQLQPTVTDLSELLKKGSYIGYQDGSFVMALLKKMGFPESKLRNYSTVDQYAEALSKGSANGGVDAIFDEIPYLKLFLSSYCSGFAMVGRTYKTDGFGFVFPRDSPLVPDISRAILNVTEGDNMNLIEDKWFKREDCPNEGSSITSSSLSFASFGGLFLITGVVSTVALLVFLAMFVYREWDELRATASGESSIWRKIVALAKHYEGSGSMHPQAASFKREGEATPTNEELHRKEEAAAAATLPECIGSQSPVSVSNHSGFILSSPEEGISSTEPNSPSARRSSVDNPMMMADIIRERS